MGHAAPPGTDGPGEDALGRWSLLPLVTHAVRGASCLREAMDAVAHALAGPLRGLVLVALRDPGAPMLVAQHHVEPGRLPTVVPPAGDLDAWVAAVQRHAQDTVARDVLLARFDDGALACVRDPGVPAPDAEQRAAFVALAEHVGLLVRTTGLARSEWWAARNWERAFETSAIGMSVVDPAGRYLAMNPAGCAIYGRRAEDVIGHDRFEFDHHEDVDVVLRDVRSMIDGGDGVERVTRIIRPTGETRWVRFARVLVRAPDGRPLAFHAQFIDLTGRVRAEARAARFEALVRSSPDFVAIGDLDGQVEFVNAAGRELAGVDADVDVTTLTYEAFLPSPTVAVPHPEIDAVRRAGTWSGLAGLRDWRDGSEIPVLATSFAIHDQDGHTIAWATIRRDIREQLAARFELERLAEQRRVLLRELVSAEANERRRLAEGLHDRSVQLLAAAQLRLHLLDLQLGRDELEAAQGTSTDTARLIAHALRALRMTLADLQPPESEGLGLAAVLTHAARILFDGSDTAVSVHGALDGMPDDLVAVVERAAREALSNARRHAAARHVDVRLGQDDGTWSVTVDDDGVGAAEVDLEARRLGHMGVRSMRSRVRAIGGTVTIGARPGGGTRVEVVVPRPAGP